MSQPPDRPTDPLQDAPDTSGDHPDELLAAYVDGSASPSASDLAEAHLSGCERCRDEVLIARRALAALRTLPELETPWEDPSAMGGAIGRSIAGSAAPAQRPRPQRSPQPPNVPATVPPLDDRRNRRRTALVGAVGLAAAASVAALVVFALSSGGGQVASTVPAATGGSKDAVAAVTQDDLAALTARLAHGGSEGTSQGASFGAAGARSPQRLASGGLEIPTSATIAPEAAGGVPCARRVSGQSVSAVVVYAEVAQFQGQRVWVIGFVTTPATGGTPRLELVAATTSDCTLVYVGRQAKS
jgi:hypothetical protein